MNSDVEKVLVTEHLPITFCVPDTSRSKIVFRVLIFC